MNKLKKRPGNTQTPNAFYNVIKMIFSTHKIGSWKVKYK